MNKFFKLLVITTSIQIVGVLAVFVMNSFATGKLEVLALYSPYLYMIAVLISLIVGIVLAIRWGENRKEKLMYIFLMPPNYLSLAVLVYDLWFLICFFVQLAKFS